MPHGHSVVIVTPALAAANNGNWQTARRWAGLLAPAYRVAVVDRWPDATARPLGPAAVAARPDLMVALHARRSAASVMAWRSACADRPLVLALTGTDLYGDLATHADAQAALAQADALVVLNARGPLALPPGDRARCHVVLQSCTARRPLAKTDRHLRVLMVGHLRSEKDPLTYLRAAQRLAGRPDILFDHIGEALDPALGDTARALAAQLPSYRWLGGLPHREVRRRIQAAHLLVHASRIEGGAHVVIEALRSGTPVLASRIDGNLGLLGDDHPAVFDVGDDQALATLVQQARDDPAMLPRLQALASQRALLFTAAAERAALARVIGPLLPPR